MLVYQESQKITSINTLKPEFDEDYFWVLDLDQKDFTLTPLSVIEAVTSPAVELIIDDSVVIVPIAWNILICDPETSQLDISDVGSLVGKNFSSFVFGFNTPMVELHTISSVNLIQSSVTYSPSLQKSQMLCHPISGDRWINLSPSDSYNKYFRNTILSGDLI